MSTWLMNFLFRKTATQLRLRQHARIGQYLGVQEVQTHLLNDLMIKERMQFEEFKSEYFEHTSPDILEKALIRAIDTDQYLMIKHKIDDLKKLRFAHDYDGYKVSTDLTGTKGRELYKLYDQVIRNEKGELANKLWKQRVETDPQAKGIIGHL